jgi:hypothetical protein
MPFLLTFWGTEGGKNAIAFFQTVHSIILIVLIVQLQVLVLEGTALFVIIIGIMMIHIAPFVVVQERARTGARA